MRVKYTLDACVDCIAYVANGDIPEDRPYLADEIAANLGDDCAYLVNADGCDQYGKLRRDLRGRKVTPDHPDYELYREDWFSWNPCECCGSHLGGDRNRLAVLREETPREKAATDREARKRRARLVCQSTESWHVHS